MLATKPKQNSTIKRIVHIKRKFALSENAKQKLLGVIMLLLAIPAMFVTNEFDEPDATASIMMVFMGIAALIGK